MANNWYLLVIKLSIIKIIFGLACGEEQKINFWNKQRTGANIFNQILNKELILKAKEYNIGFLRIAPDKFKTKARDYLIGNADDYTALNQEDIKHLTQILDECADAKMPVVITMLSLPGSRWIQNNKDKDDLRIWQSEKFQIQAAKFWRDLAFIVKDYNNIIGYDILNEPHPERLYDTKSIDIDKVEQDKVQKMLSSFYAKTISAIREVDQFTPIIIESSSYGSPPCFENLFISKDPNIIYSFHMYEPYSYTNAQINEGKFTYPGKVKNIYWNKQQLVNYLKPIINFQNKNKIDSSRILVGEFGGNRTTPNIELYFKDLITIFNDNNWHSAVYAFREDTWEGMNYELGKTKVPYSYWQQIEKGNKPTLPMESDNPIFNVLRSYWKQ